MRDGKLHLSMHDGNLNVVAFFSGIKVQKQYSSALIRDLVALSEGQHMFYLVSKMMFWLSQEFGVQFPMHQTRMHPLSTHFA